MFRSVFVTITESVTLQIFVKAYVIINYRKYSQLKVSQLSILFNEKNSIYAKMLFKML